MDVIHIWDFPNTSIKLDSQYLSKIREEIRRRGSLKKIYSEIQISMMFSSFKNLFVKTRKEFIPSYVLQALCKELNIPINEFEEHVLKYRSTRGRFTVKHVRLPVKITPLFYMILSHIMADGNCIRIKGKTPYFGYVQYDKQLMKSFTDKLKSQFGEIDFIINRNRVYLPSSISMAMANKANIQPKDFLSDRARVPKPWFKLDKKHLVAILTAFIIDEGHIDSGQIVIGLHNKELLNDLKKICDNCEYVVTLKDSKHLYVLAEGVKKYWKDYQKLKKQFPSVTLGYKEDKIKEFILRKRKIWRSKGQGETKNAIIFLLKEQPRTINEIATMLQISRQGVRFHFKELLAKSIVKRSGLAKDAAIVYKLDKEHRFAVKRKGMSRQEGKTKQKILKLLESPMTSVTLSKTLKIDRTTILNFLYNMENKDNIERCGVKIHKTRPAILWKKKQGI